MKDVQDKIKDYLSNGQTDNALALLVQHAKEKRLSIHDEAVLLSGQYRQWERDRMLGVEQTSSELRRIELGILRLLQDEGKPVQASAPLQKAPPLVVPATGSGNGKLLLGAGAGILVIGLLFWMLSGGEDSHNHGHEDTIAATSIDLPEENATNEELPPQFDDVETNSTNTPEPTTSVPGSVPSPSTTTASQTNVNAKTVNLVAFGNNPSSPDGYFRHLPDKVWVEEDTDFAIRFRFVETERDGSNIYLTATDRDVEMQLDLSNNVVYYTEPNKEQLSIYKINNAVSKMNGEFAKLALYTNGSGEPTGYFHNNTNTNKWEEVALPSEKVLFEFEEEGRDEWSVYLTDASQNKKIAIDFYQMKVKVDENGTGFRNLYNVVESY